MLIIFILMFLPLQTTWAAAGSYYQHERGSAAQHVGHHEHQTQNNDKVEAKLVKSAFMVDADCDFCHPCCGAIMPEDARVTRYAAPLTFETASICRTTSAISSAPDRPNWLLLV